MSESNSPSAPTVALLGTGTMGAAMARRIAGAGMELRVWNRSREKAEPLSDVATVADEPADAVRGADVVVTMLLDADAVLDVLRRAQDALADGVVAQMSTVGVEGCDRVAAWARGAGVALVDAPVSGTKEPAEQGKLVVLAAGADADVERCRPVFEAVGQRTVTAGGVGAGSRLKLAVNTYVAELVEALAESLALVEALGLDRQLLLDTISGGPLDSGYVQTKVPKMIGDDLDEASFPLAGALKDLGLITAAGRAAGVELPAAEATRAQFQRAADAGQDRADLAAVYRTLRPAGA